MKNRQKHFAIDVEAVILGVDGTSDFNAVHSRKHDHEVQLFAFDLLAMEGDDLRSLPLHLRKANLEQLLARQIALCNGLEWHSLATLTTWGMTLVIQRAEHRDTQAIHAKLDELLKVHGDASNSLMTVDDKHAEEVERERAKVHSSMT
ncbi:low affinity iron permease family protein [Bradyrhizobium sp. CB82]|uniref:low affinity iron permease family protein n=1 Tax=Bradyrhizobium sp. CB82 TaxID=3039159 RepID=UPI0032C2405F